MFFKNKPREFIDPILDTCVQRYKELTEEDQVEFKSGVKSFIRTYNFYQQYYLLAKLNGLKSQYSLNYLSTVCQHHVLMII